MKDPRPRRKSISAGSATASRQALKNCHTYEGALDWALAIAGGRECTAAVRDSVAVPVSIVGRDFFPSVDAGTLRLHVRCPPGTRLEAIRGYFQHVGGLSPATDSRQRAECHRRTTSDCQQY